MKKLTKREKQRILSRLFWDTHDDPKDVLLLLTGKEPARDRKEYDRIYRRLLTSCDWYTILKLVPGQKMVEILSDPVIDGLFPKDLQEKYRYARSILQK